MTANTYAVIAKDGKQAICNSGIIDLGENLLIFDTFNSPIPARELMRAASDLFHKPIKYIVNSHYHTDHTRGNQVFVDSEIISSKYTAQNFVKREQTNIKEQQNTIPNRLKNVEENLANLKSSNESRNPKEDFEVRNLEVWRGYLSGVHESLPILKPTPPTRIFESELQLTGSATTIKLHEVGPTHTQSDVYLWMEDEQVLFTGDLLSSGYHPMASETNFSNLIKTLNHFIDLQPKHVVPGHGPVTDVKGISKLISYFEQLMQLADKLKTQNSHDIDQLINSTHIPNEFETWIFGPEFYPLNLQNAINQL